MGRLDLSALFPAALLYQPSLLFIIKKPSSFFPDFKPIKKIIIHTNRGKHGGDNFNRSHKDPVSLENAPSKIHGQGHMTVDAEEERVVTCQPEENH